MATNTSERASKVAVPSARRETPLPTIPDTLRQHPLGDEAPAMFHNIATVLGGSVADLKDIHLLTEGMTNLSFRFTLDGDDYVYRHPGVGTDKIINRRSETFSQEAAYRLGIDGTYIHENPEEGWKVARYLPTSAEFDYHNKDHVRKGMELIRKLHMSGESSGYDFDIHEDTRKILSLLDEGRQAVIEDFEVLYEQAEALDELVRLDGVEPCLCHNDFFDRNFLINETAFYLIDWEYSGMGDYASDLAVFVCCCQDYEYADVIGVFEAYFGRPLASEELRHCLAYMAITGFHWLVWALYQDMVGNPADEYLRLYHRYAKEYSQRALDLYASGETSTG